MLFIMTTILQLLLTINLTLIGGILPLIERKYLSLIQRRVGPKFVGYKGRLQFLADALKMFLKGKIIPHKLNNTLFFIWPLSFLSCIYLLHLNTFWGVNLVIADIEYNLLFMTIINLMLSCFSFFAGYFTKNKYGIIGAFRFVLVVSCGEIVVTSVFLLFIFFTSSLTLCNFYYLQFEYCFALIFNGVALVVFLILLVEVAKSPFDLAEAETELVTGFHTEYGAFFFALFYLGEYLHIYFSSAFIVFALLGF